MLFHCAKLFSNVRAVLGLRAQLLFNESAVRRGTDSHSRSSTKPKKRVLLK